MKNYKILFSSIIPIKKIPNVKLSDEINKKELKLQSLSSVIEKMKSAEEEEDNIKKYIKKEKEKNKIVR